MCNQNDKIDYSEAARFSYGYSYGGGWDIDMSDRTQKESDSGHIPGRYQWEETTDVSDDEKPE